MPSLLSSGPYYVRLSKARLVVLNVANGKRFDDVPFIGLTEDQPPKVAAIGATANMLFERNFNPFSHPRVIVSDFEVAEALLMHVFKLVSGAKYFRFAPEVIMHATDEFIGGLTDVEKRILKELALGAGARKVYIWEGVELSQEDIHAGVYKDS